MAALAAACLAGVAAAEAAPEPVAVSGEFHRVVLRVPLRLEVTEGETALAVAAEPAVPAPGMRSSRVRRSSLEADTDGSGDVDASGFPVKQARVGTRGPGNVSVRLDGGTLCAHRRLGRRHLVGLGRGGGGAGLRQRRGAAPLDRGSL